MNRLILVLGFVFFTMPVRAQLQQMVVGVNGLTCSQCSKSVYMKLTKLTFVKDVQMDLNTHTATIQLVHEDNYDLDKIAQAIVDAGYSVRQIKLTWEKSGLQFGENFFLHAHKKYYFTQAISAIPAVFSTTLVGKKYGTDKRLNELIPTWYNKNHNTYFTIIE